MAKKRPKRPSDRHVWCSDSKQWLSPRELGKLTEAWYGRVQAAGYVDIEYLRGGKVSDALLCGDQRSCSLSVLDAAAYESGDIPAHYHTLSEAPQAVAHARVVRKALKAYVERRPWRRCAALALRAAGHSKPRVAQVLKLSRTTLDQWLREDKLQ